ATQAVACVRAGTPLVVTNAEVGAGDATDCNGNRARLCASTYDVEEPQSERRWLHVEAEDGTAGWAQPTDLEWAAPKAASLFTAGSTGVLGSAHVSAHVSARVRPRAICRDRPRAAARGVRRRLR